MVAWQWQAVSGARTDWGREGEKDVRARGAKGRKRQDEVRGCVCSSWYGTSACRVDEASGHRRLLHGEREKDGVQGWVGYCTCYLVVFRSSECDGSSNK